MNRIDASEHYDDSSFKGQTPSLLTVIIDTNPRAWAALKSVLPISQAIANILVFINAHLAFGNDNQVAVFAAHTNRAVWLYPNRGGGGGGSGDGSTTAAAADEERVNSYGNGNGNGNGNNSASANKYPQFAQIESSILSALRDLINNTTPADIGPTTPLIAGALTLALSHINKTSLAFAPPKSSSSSDPANPTGVNATSTSTSSTSTSEQQPTLHARILVVSVSDSAPSQYIPTMNAVFAASHARIPIDTLAVRGAPTFLQQAAYITGGMFLSASSNPPALAPTTNPSTQPAPPSYPNPRGLLSYLMFAFLADAQARQALVNPTQDTVDFRAACFCHRRVIDTGFVCSVCLSIFCEVPQQQLTEALGPTNGENGGGGAAAAAAAECLTCGTRLALGLYGAKPAVVPRKRAKKKKARVNGVSMGPDTGSAVGTPAP